MTPREAYLALDHLYHATAGGKRDAMLTFMRYIVGFPTEAVSRAFIALPTKCHWFPSLPVMLDEIRSYLPPTKPTEAETRGYGRGRTVSHEQFVENNAAINGWLAQLGPREHHALLEGRPLRLIAVQPPQPRLLNDIKVKEITDGSDIHSDG